ncbi:response regulator [Streptomyces sp. NPDC086835]|uniref:response regulator n=1 Tax=Streptomyces sp. NPDC086835 TaxID=3365761 RepID=UPI00381E9E6A
MPRILVIDNDPVTRTSLEKDLTYRGHQVESASTGESGLDAIGHFNPDLTLVELTLSDINGIDLCRRVRSFSTLPIIMITAQGSDFDVVEGLEAGADDYIVKPAGHAVIDARIHAVLRRSWGREIGGISSELHGDLVIHRSALTATKRGRIVPLAPCELGLLLFLSSTPQQVFSRQVLLQHIWEDEESSGIRAVDACVRRLRSKIEDTPSRPRFIQTVRGFGYRFGPV